MALSNETRTQRIAEAADKIVELTATNKDVAEIALGIEYIGFFIKNLLGDLCTYDLAALNEELHGSDLQTFNEITSSTSGIGLVPIGIYGSPQPLLDGTLLSFGPDGRKIQILAYNSGTLWFKVNEDDAGVYSQWRKINAGIVNHLFYDHPHNKMARPGAQTHNISISEGVQSVQITLWGAGGGGGGPNFVGPRVGSRGAVRTHQAYVGEAAGESKVQYFVDNTEVFTLIASGGIGGNDVPVNEGSVQGTSFIPDARTPSATSPVNYSIPGGGMPGGISQKFLDLSPLRTDISAIPQDGLAGELSVGSFEVTGPGRLVITLAPGGRNAGYDTEDFILNGLGYIGKAAAAEVIMF